MKNIKLYSTLAVLFSIGCTKFVQVPPPNTQIVGATVYSSDATAAAAVTGIYETMVNNSIGGGPTGISVLAGLSADEVALYPGSAPLLTQVYLNAQLSNSPPSIWGDLYNCLYQANYAVAALSASSGVDSALKTQLTGEAEFVRAFCLFYLTELYENVPLVTSPAYQINESLAGSPQAQVYQQIVADLSNAQGLLSDTYSTATGLSTNQRIRPNKSTTTALLARVYLYEHNWDSAYIEASTVINDGQYILESNLNYVFVDTSSEDIWQLQPVDNGNNTPDGQAFLPCVYYGLTPSTTNPLYLDTNLVNAFEPNDQRRIMWIDSSMNNGTVFYYPYKYQLYYTGASPTEYTVVLRLAEQYLIRAEAEAYGVGGGITGAINDLNTIRGRAGLPNYSGATDQTSMLNAILRERRVELFTEYGHRWLDLQRTNAIDSVMTPACSQKGGTWSHYAELFPIPFSDIQADSKLTQNPGYN